MDRIVGKGEHVKEKLVTINWRKVNALEVEVVRIHNEDLIVATRKYDIEYFVVVGIVNFVNLKNMGS